MWSNVLSLPLQLVIVANYASFHSLAQPSLFALTDKSEGRRIYLEPNVHAAKVPMYPNCATLSWWDLLSLSEHGEVKIQHWFNKGRSFYGKSGWKDWLVWNVYFIEKSRSLNYFSENSLLSFFRLGVLFHTSYKDFLT
jgi:hypothetical protein